MSQFSKSLDLLIRSMEQGRDLKISSGHTLSWSEEHQGPGFLAIQEPSYDSPDGLPQEIIFQINSDVAWMSLIDHARKMSERDFTVLAANMALTEINRSKR